MCHCGWHKIHNSIKPQLFEPLRTKVSSLEVFIMWGTLKFPGLQLWWLWRTSSPTKELPYSLKVSHCGIFHFFSTLTIIFCLLANFVFIRKMARNSNYCFKLTLFTLEKIAGNSNFSILKYFCALLRSLFMLEKRRENSN